MKRLAIIIIAISLWLSLLVTKVQAYWAEDVLSSQSINVTSISIGNWLFITEWVENETYEEGDVVEWNGKTYIRNSIGGPNQGGRFAPDSWIGWVFWDEAN